MTELIQLISIVLAFISHNHEAIAAANESSPSSSIVVHVNKHTDAATPLYSANANFNVSWYFRQNGVPTPLPKQQNLLIDLDAPFIWHYCYPHQESCDACPYPVTCREYPCTDLRTTFSYKSPSCPPPTNSSIYEGYYDCELCPVNIVNPVTGSCTQAIPTYDEFMFNITNDGRNVLSDLYTTYPTAACAPPSTFDPFPSNVFGVIALSSSPYALPEYLRDPVERIIALCLPCTLYSPGVLFLGNGPYYLLPQSHVDVRSLLSYTVLLKQPNSFGYFIGVKAIVIKNRSINVGTNAITKISTLDPYTKLRTDIYNNVVRRFSRVTKRIPPAKLKAPFGLCFNTTVNGTKVGLRVPDIDLVLRDGKKWTISSANSIKQVTEDVACLAFVDGGATSEHAIVVGTYQFEDNFLLFDLENSSFGFSSSLLRRQTSCSNFFINF
ncbi:hypothetical protein L1987_85512 [Smallanthus sonchifolius]|uniref:Uncharacterized protein n=1 Tax=Smallanthus sonchifolius TaxID=185202 RepID=A0ACB8XWY1_9ASTR|nr:hypothetical protein L1987_85512 [Smallanthus sonchifolius]